MRLRESVLLALLSAALTTPSLAADGETVSGSLSVIDGDRVEIQGRRLHLTGIDAPELRQTCADAVGTLCTCGRVAEVALAEKVVGKTVTCTERIIERRPSGLAMCRLETGEDLAAWLVSEGLAVADRSGGTAYGAQEEVARSVKRGLWAGSFTMPWDLRRGVRGKPDGYSTPVGLPLVVESERQAEPVDGTDCQIKGNITREGSKLYWVPGSRRYRETVITPSTGERWFCTEEEARQAGWQEPAKLPPTE